MTSREIGEIVSLACYWAVVGCWIAGGAAAAAALVAPGRAGAPLLKLAERIDGVSRMVGKTAALLLLLIAGLVTLTVGARLAFGLGAPGLEQGAIFTNGALILLTGAYALADDAHVRVDVFQRRFGEKTRACVDLVGALALVGSVAFVIAWFSYYYVAQSWGVLERSGESGGLPGVFLLKTCLPVFAVLMTAQAAAQAVRAAARLRGIKGAASAAKGELL